MLNVKSQWIKKRWIRFLVFSLGAVVLGGMLFLQKSQDPSGPLTLAFQFWKEGVKKVPFGNEQAYLKDGCKKDALASECSCVALLHGEGEDADSWSKILLWPKSNWEMMGLNRSARLLAFNLPKTGTREMAEKWKPILADICSEWIVVGQGLGAGAASWLALIWPSGVQRLLLMGAKGLRFQREEKSFFQETPSLAKLQDYYTRAYARPRTLSPREWTHAFSRFQKASAKNLLDAQSERDDLDLAFPTLHLPVMFLWGKEDRVTPIEFGRRMKTLAVNGIWREVPECGHFPQKECPLVVVQSIIDLTRFGAI